MSAEAEDRTAGREGASDPSLVDRRGAILGGAFAAMILLGVIYSVGAVSGAESRRLLQATVPSIRFFGSAVLSASATILALMLTLLSLTHTTETTFAPQHWQRVKQIALATSAAIIGAIFLLLFLGLPLEESSNVPAEWYGWVYYVLMSLAALLGGLLVSIVIMLYKAVVGFIDLLREGGESRLAAE